MFKLIAEGEEGAVFYQSFNQCIKFGLKYSILNELKNIKLLPAEGPYFDTSQVSMFLTEKDIGSYVLKKTIKLSKRIRTVDIYRNFSIEEKISMKGNNSINRFFKELNGDYDSTLYELRMPYLHGKTLYKHLYGERIYKVFPSFVNVRYYNFYIVEIEREDFFKLINALIILYFNVLKINNENLIYFNDLHMNNIIYNGEDMKIIDFGNLSVGEPIKTIRGIENFTDVENLIIILKVIILCGSINLELKELLITNEIINDDDVSFDCFVQSDEILFDYVKEKFTQFYV